MMRDSHNGKHNKGNAVLVVLALILPIVIESITLFFCGKFLLLEPTQIHPIILLLMEGISLMVVVGIANAYHNPIRNEKVKLSGYLLIVGVVGAGLSQGVMISIESFISHISSFEVTNADSQIDFIEKDNIQQIVILLVVILVIAPILEELSFRYMLFSELRSRLNSPVAIFISAGVFGIAHMDLSLAITTFGMGVWLAYVYDRLRNIVLNIMIHGIMNAIASIVLFLNDSSNEETLSVGETLTGLIWLIPFLVITVIAVERAYRKKNSCKDKSDISNTEQL